MPRKVRILSLDGGGIRGILPGVILAELENRLRKREGDDQRLADYFELVAGTSTGGILSCGYLVPDESEGRIGRPKYTAKEVVNVYLERGDEIFRVSLLQMVAAAGGLFDEKYKADALEDELETFFGDVDLGSLVRPCLIPAYDIRRRRTKFFNSTDGAKQTKNFSVRDVARATSAAPTYFEASMIESKRGVEYPLIDGGLFANNPSMCAYSEARGLDFRAIFKDETLPNCPTAKDMMILSIGTGQVSTPYHFENAKDWGAMSWIRPVLDIMMSGTSEIVDYQLRQMFDTLPDSDQGDYIRIEPDLHDASPEMDDVSAANIRALEQAGLNYVADNEKLLEGLVDKLIALGPTA